MKRRTENSLSPGIRPTFSLLSVPWGQFFWRGATYKVAGEPMGVRERPSPMLLAGEKKRMIIQQCPIVTAPNYVPTPRSGRKRGAGRGKGTFKAPELS